MKISNHSYYIQPGDKFRPKSMAIANAMAIELISYGVYVSPMLLCTIASNKKTVAMEFCDSILKDYTVGQLTPPLFQNWESRTEFSLSEYVVQIFGYIIQLSGNDLADPAYMETLLTKVEFKKTKTINLATIEDAKQLFIELSKSKVGLDRKQLNVLAGLSKYFYKDITDRIQSDEARIAVLLELSADIGLYDALLALKCKPADVLRYAAGLLNITAINLPSDVKYAVLSWSQRTAMLQFLNQFGYDKLFEDTGINREAWTRFYNHVHLFGQSDFINRFPVVGLVSRISMGHKSESLPKQYASMVKQMIANELVELSPSDNLVYRTFASRIQSAIGEKDISKLEVLLENNGGYLLRNLATVANAIEKNDEARFVELVRSKLSSASANQLFSILGINVDATYRVIDVKGNTIIEPANYPSVIRDIQGDAKRVLYSRYGFAGKVKVNAELGQRVVPFLSRNAELDRGTRVKVNDDNYLYMFMHWVQAQNRRTDLDLSVVAFDADWMPMVVYFGYQVNKYIVHGGDITNAPAPNGATEYIRIDLKMIPSNVKYILPVINVYTGAALSLNAVAYAGFHTTDSGKFDISRDTVRYDLTAPANSNVPFMLDVDTKEIVMLDFNDRERIGATAHAGINNLKKLVTAVQEKNVVTIAALADILSGPGDDVSLHIKKTAVEAHEIEPANLSTLFN